MHSHPISISVTEGSLERGRASTFFRPLLAIPHFVWTTIWGFGAVAALVIGWVAALVTGRVPGPCHSLMAGYLKYSARVTAYVSIMTDEYPPFTSAGDYPLSLAIGPPEPQGRGSVFFRPLLAVPAIMINSVVSAATGIGALLFWFRVLFTGNVTPGLLALMAYSVRYQNQVSAYMMLLTPHYPDSNPLLEAEPAE